MATAKAERLLNLVIALLNSPRFRTAGWIRERVAGYGDPPTEEAFFRTFERDKTELRDLGIPLQTPDDGTDGYRIPPGEFALPQLTFTPAETAALGLAARLWETTALAGPGSTAIRKIRDAGTADPETAQHVEAATLLQPRVRTGDPAFSPIYAAVRAGRAVEFDYRKSPVGPGEPRQVEPWGLVSFAGRWYLVGYDTERQARRTFRLSRIVGRVRSVGRAGAATVPEGLDLLDLVANSVEIPADRTTTLLIRPGTGTGLRRRADRDGQADPPGRAEPSGHAARAGRLGSSGNAARPDSSANTAPSQSNQQQVDLDPVGRHAGWDVVRMPFAHLWDTARMIAEQGPDVFVAAPPDLREAVIRLLVGARSSDGPPDDSARGTSISGLRTVESEPVLLDAGPDELRQDTAATADAMATQAVPTTGQRGRS